MTLLIADTFTDSLAKLTNQEQKAVKLTAFDLQTNPDHPGHSFHKLDGAKDKNFWSVRVNRDVRIIVHRGPKSLLLAYVDHHDDAYAWAERRRLETHPRTGAAQIVEVRERVEEIAPEPATAKVKTDVSSARHEPLHPPLFEALGADGLLSVGVPEDWVDEVLAASEDGFLELAEHLPAEAAEALLTYAATGVLDLPEPAAPTADPFAHPDAQRRFRVMDNVEELERALDYPWERWSVFLHPAQRRFAEARHKGPARVAGSAGTGKTVVALHRAVNLARAEPDACILLTTFSKTLASALALKLSRLCANEPGVKERITVTPLDQAAYRLYAKHFATPQIASAPQVRAALQQGLTATGSQSFSETFLLAEWNDVVDAWSIRSWEAYQDVPRLGRKIRLGPRQREEAWAVFETARARLAERGLVTWPEVYDRLADLFATGRPAPFDHIIVDEAQDLAVAELRFLAAMAGDRPDGLFFAGDLGQRIFRPPFSWKALGVDVRGRSATLRVNYRTSHQIRTSADLLLPDHVRDVDGEETDRRGTVSVFNGPSPRIKICDDRTSERDMVACFIGGQIEAGTAPEEIGIFVRTEQELSRARKAVRTAGLEATELDASTEPTPGTVSIATMHWAKGLEFKAVAVMACDDDILPHQERIETIVDQADLDEVYETERHLLYVACTRARDALLVSGVDPASEFLEDMFLAGS